jgi:2-polyprenyl-3-methyl-5-hydroxy-6-metoxy-1,4-benzoquinol methylase
MIITDERKSHWENVYTTKQPHEVSWTQEVPTTSLKIINSFNLDKSAGIIDIGGGDSNLVDFLLSDGYTNITVLDISGEALARAKKRLGAKADNVKWIESDITEFKPTEQYAVWHDRAAFHFLTTPEQIANYVATAAKAVTGYLAIGTFSENGPKRCSGLDITQYSEEKLENTFTASFKKTDCLTEDHTTPFNTTQNFIFCSFKKR